MDQLVLEDAKALDTDIRAAMEARMTFDELFLKWIQPRKPPERTKYSRYIAERVHDVLGAWGS